MRKKVDPAITKHFQKLAQKSWKKRREAILKRSKNPTPDVIGNYDTTGGK